MAPASERCETLDLLRGFALFGVLTINLLDFFRVSLFEVILRFHTPPGALNHFIDAIMAGLVEFKAFELFSLSFGIGMAVQSERAQRRGVTPEFSLARRFVILLAIGLLHLVFVSNVDILTLYAVCGFALLPFLRLPPALLALAGMAAVYLPDALSAGTAIPSAAVLRAHAAEAARIYGQGSFTALLPFRWQETKTLIVPLLIGSAQRTFGLMLVGMALWRAGILRNPARFRTPLLAVALLAGAAGLLNTTFEVLAASEGVALHPPRAFGWAGSSVPLACAYAAALLAWRRLPRARRLTAPVAAAGQMALSNYLMQTLLCAFLFYGYGLGLFGRLAPAPALALGLAVYAAQLQCSRWWLRRHRFGPFEWLWRSLAYGRRQPLRLSAGTLPAA